MRLRKNISGLGANWSTLNWTIAEKFAVRELCQTIWSQPCEKFVVWFRLGLFILLSWNSTFPRSLQLFWELLIFLQKLLIVLLKALNFVLDAILLKGLVKPKCTLEFAFLKDEPHAPQLDWRELLKLKGEHSKNDLIVSKRIYLLRIQILVGSQNSCLFTGKQHIAPSSEP